MKTVSIGAALLAQLAAPSLPHSGQKMREVHVAVADLDLSSAKGMATLDRRLVRAVLKVCGTAHYLDSAQMADMELCRVDASRRASAARQALLDAKMGKVEPLVRSIE